VSVWRSETAPLTGSVRQTRRKNRKVEPGAVYLNVDLEIRSRSNLRPLVDALRRRLFVLHAGRVRGVFFASFEVGGVTLPPDAAIGRLARALSDLPPSLRRLWEGARDRVFDIGLEKTTGRGRFPLALRQETVKTIARLDARVALTLYSHVSGQRRKLPAVRRTQRSTAPASSRRG
jgi:hypothetical protein